MRKELFSPLRIYTSREKRFKNRKFYATDNIDYTLAAPKTSWLPWIFLRTPSSKTISGIKVNKVSDDTTAFEISNQGTIDSLVNIFQLRDTSGTVTDDIICYNGGSVAGMTLETGEYYLEIVDSSNDSVFTEDFCVVFDTCDYIRVSWLHSTDIDYFPYSKGFKHHAYIDSDLIEEEPRYNVKEVPNGKDEPIEIFHSVSKIYKLKTDLLPPFMVDALSMIPLHDTVTLSKPNLSVHIENSNLKNITFDPGEYVTRLAYDGSLSFKLETIVKIANNENLRISEIITSDESHTLSNGFSTKFDACNNVGAPSTTTFYSVDSTLVVNSVLYTTSLDTTSYAPSGWYRDASSGKSLNIGVNGVITEIFTCLTEYTHSYVSGSFADDAAACSSLSSLTTYYSEDQTIIIGSVLFTTSQDVTSVVSDGKYFDRSADKVITVSSGAVSAIGSQCSETTHGMKGSYANANLACEGTGADTNYYSRDSSLIVGSVIYTTSHLNNSFLGAGWYYLTSANKSLEVSSNGVIVSITDCAAESSFTVVGPETTESAAASSTDSTITIYSLDSILAFAVVVYGTSGDQDSFLPDGWYRLNSNDDTFEVLAGEIIAYNEFNPQ